MFEEQINYDVSKYKNSKTGLNDNPKHGSYLLICFDSYFYDCRKDLKKQLYTFFFEIDILKRTNKK